MTASYTHSFDENPEVEALIREANRILESATDLNDERNRLEEIFKRIMKWTGNDGYYEEFYENYKRVLIAMGDFDFSQRMPVAEGGSNFPGFIALGLNIINEELEDAAFSSGIIKSLINASMIKNRVFIITDNCGKVRCVKACQNIDGFDENYLLKKHIKVLFEDFRSLDQRIMKEGFGKEFEVKLRKPRTSAMLNVYYNSLLSKTEGIVYALRFK